MLALLCATAQGAWAQTIVGSEEDLYAAIEWPAQEIQLSKDILLSNYLNINGGTLTIDLNGHKLYRSLSNHGSEGHVIWAHGGCNLTLTSSVAGGSIEGGMANNGGAIHIPHGNTVSAHNVIFRNNSAADHAGAIWNNGTFTATNCTFANNTAKDVGGIYNAVTDEGAGTATLTGCTFKGNAGTAGAGALANAVGATVMTIDGGTITGNTADTYGAGIWNGGTLNMKGKITVQNNTIVGGMVSNVYLKNGKVITVTGSLTGSNIGVEMESTQGTFTSGYSDYQHDQGPIFTPDHSTIVGVGMMDGELYLMTLEPGSLYFIERSWDETNRKVVSTEKAVGTPIAYDVIPTSEGQYKEVTNAPAGSPDEWFGMGNPDCSVPEYYVVHGNVERQTIVVQGSNVHLILCNGAKLRLTGGLKLEGDNKLYIHCQSYGGAMGKLIVTNTFEYAAGIGSARDNGKEKAAGELVVYGGHIEAKGGRLGAGIGSCAKTESTFEDLCKSVTVYGGYVKAEGGEKGAGIGAGAGHSYYTSAGGRFTLYDGTVEANGDKEAAGIGGGGADAYGNGGSGGVVNIHGGTLTARGGEGAAGIGGGRLNTLFIEQQGGRIFFFTGGGLVNITGGSVTAVGGKYAAGIGGGDSGKGAVVTISGGDVMAVGGQYAPGIGSGRLGDIGDVTITGGTVTAIGGGHGAGIGGSTAWHIDEKMGEITIAGGTVIAQGGAYGAGIGGNNGAAGITVKISGGEVKAFGGIQAAGIGGGGDEEGAGGNVTITGGTVIARAGDANGAGAIGPGEGYEYDEDDNVENNGYGTLEIGNGMMVGAGNDVSVESIFAAAERVNACWHHTYAEISPCTHPGATYNADGTGVCTICGAEIELSISLADNSDNAETLNTYNGKTAFSVTLTDRTLYRDGSWNTLCLPFEVSTATAPLSGDGVVAMTLDTQSSGFSNGTLTLNFTDVEDAPIPAGTPFIIKWTNDTEHPTIYEPTFNNVTISNATNNATVPDVVTFTGTYSPVSITEAEGDKTKLYLGAGNTLYYPSSTMTIGAFRAYFQLLGDLTAGEPESGKQPIRAFNLNFGEEEMGIRLMEEGRGRMEDAWFTLDGRKLMQKPVAKGIYICGGRKVIIK